MTDFWVPWGGRFPRLFIDANGRPMAGAVLSAYKARTTTPANMFDGIGGDTIGSSVRTSSGDDAGYIERDESALTSADTLILVASDAPTVTTEIVGATWNPDKTGSIRNGSSDDSAFAFTNNNRTVEAISAPSTKSVAAAQFPKDSGKWYWEILVDSNPSGSTRVGAGICEHNDPGSPADIDDVSWRFLDGGQKNCDASDVSFGLSGWGTGDVIMFALDLDTPGLWFGLNGSFNGDPAAGTGAACTNFSDELDGGAKFVPGIHFPAGVSGLKYTIRTQASQLSHSAPSGFNKGWY